MATPKTASTWSVGSNGSHDESVGSNGSHDESVVKGEREREREREKKKQEKVEVRHSLYIQTPDQPPTRPDGIYNYL